MMWKKWYQPTCIFTNIFWHTFLLIFKPYLHQVIVMIDVNSVFKTPHFIVRGKNEQKRCEIEFYFGRITITYCGITILCLWLSDLCSLIAQCALLKATVACHLVCVCVCVWIVSLTEWPLLWKEPVGHWMWHICIRLIRAAALTGVPRCPASETGPFLSLSKLKVNDKNLTFLVGRENGFIFQVRES